MKEGQDRMVLLNNHYKKSFGILENLNNALMRMNSTDASEMLPMSDQLFKEAVHALVTLSHAFKHENAVLNQLRKLIMQLLINFEKIVDGGGGEGNLKSQTLTNQFIDTILMDMTTLAEEHFLLLQGLVSNQDKVWELQICLIKFYCQHAIILLRHSYWKRRITYPDKLVLLAKNIVDFIKNNNLKDWLGKIKSIIDLADFQSTNSEYLENNERSLNKDSQPSLVNTKDCRKRPSEMGCNDPSSKKVLISDRENVENKQIVTLKKVIQSELLIYLFDILLLKGTSICAKSWNEALIRFCIIAPFLSIVMLNKVVLQVMHSYVESIGTPNEFLFIYLGRNLLKGLTNDRLQEVYRHFEKREIYQLIIFNWMMTEQSHTCGLRLMEGPLEKKWTMGIQLLSKVMRKGATQVAMTGYLRILCGFIEIYYERIVQRDGLNRVTFHGQRIHVLIEEFYTKHSSQGQLLDGRTKNWLERLAIRLDETCANRPVMFYQLANLVPVNILEKYSHGNVEKNGQNNWPQFKDWLFLGLLDVAKSKISHLSNDLREQFKEFIESKMAQKEKVQESKDLKIHIKNQKDYKQYWLDLEKHFQFLRSNYPENNHKLN